MGKLSTEIQRLAMQQREFLIKVLETCVTLKTHVETDLQNGCWSHFPEITDARETLGKTKAGLQMSETPGDVYNLHSQLMLEKQRLQSKYQEMMLQCQLDDLIGNSNVIFDFTLLKQALAGIQSGGPIVPQGMVGNGAGGRPNHMAASQNPILFLANYCMSQLYTRHIVSKQQQQQQQQHHMQNGSIEYHPSMMQPPPQQAPSGSVHAVHQGPSPSTPSGQTGPPQQLLMPPGSPSIKPVPNAPPNATMLHPQQQSTAFMPDTVGTGSSGSGSLVTVHSSPQPTPSIAIAASGLRGPANPYPLYYFNIEVNGSPHGRIVIEVRPDAAPKMTKNFNVLSTGEAGVGYKGCTIFQCWEGESVITGDFELNNGRGGRSVICEDGYFMPDDTKFPAVRGAVGMRRTQKRHDNFGMVGSQFRIILQEMRGFTGIFGHVVEGLELVEKISTFGDQTGKPTKNILITKCGKL